MNLKPLLFALVLFAGGSLGAETINYQGRLRIDGAPVDGPAQMQFAIVNEQGAAIWKSGLVTLSVSNGVYNVALGDTAAGMPVISSDLLKAGARLRISYQDKGGHWQQVGDDVSLAGAANTNISGAQADAILAELREIKTLLARQAAAPAPAAPAKPEIVTVPIGDGPSLGKEDAPVVLVEFTDFQCGFCKRFHDETFPALKKSFVDSGKVRVLTRNLPLSFHAQAEPAARAAFCASQQKKFWPMYEELFKISNSLSAEAIEKAATEIGLNLDAFHKCVDKPETKAAVAADGKIAEGVAISGTPTFVIGKAENGKITGLKVVGAQSQATFEAEINNALASAGAPRKTAQK